MYTPLIHSEYQVNEKIVECFRVNYSLTFNEENYQLSFKSAMDEIWYEKMKDVGIKKGWEEVLSNK